jgi:hypothetical protein
MAASAQRGAPWLLILALLVGLGGAGVYNYHRNWQAEEAVPRPYRGYADGDLRALIEAYEQELEAPMPEGPAASAARPPSGALLGEQIAAFERARAAGDAHRERLSERAQREAVLRELQKERALRAQLGGGISLHLRRLLTI